LLLLQPDVFLGADITYDPVLVSCPQPVNTPTHTPTSFHSFPSSRQIKDFCSAMLAMMKAVGRSIDVLVTATVRTQAQPRRNALHLMLPCSAFSHRAVCVPGADGVCGCVRLRREAARYIGQTAAVSRGRQPGAAAQAVRAAGGSEMLNVVRHPPDLNSEAVFEGSRTQGCCCLLHRIAVLKCAA
jgi:hypothetical protein